MKYIASLPALILCVLSTFSADIQAANGQQETVSAAATLLLTHPESAFVAPPAGVANFVVSIDHQPLPYDAPQILFQKFASDADFIAGVWKDAQGNVAHQREVLIVKPDYGVVVDHLYGWKSCHEVSCVVALPAGELKAEGGVHRFNLGSGKDFIVQYLGSSAPSADPTITSSAGFSSLSETYRLSLPAPFASVFYSGRSAAPKIEYIKPSNPMVVKCKVTLPDGRIDEVGIAWEWRDQLHLGGKVMKGWAAVARKGPGAAGDIEIK
ncbi:MAG: hypothetical protein WCH57_00590 [Verrucomicrobiota bacterium]